MARFGPQRPKKKKSSLVQTHSKVADNFHYYNFIHVFDVRTFFLAPKIHIRGQEGLKLVGNAGASSRRQRAAWTLIGLLFSSIRLTFLKIPRALVVSTTELALYTTLQVKAHTVTNVSAATRGRLHYSVFRRYYSTEYSKTSPLAHHIQNVRLWM